MSKTGRNNPCPCGSGKKFKHCCGEGGHNIIPFPGSEYEFEEGGDFFSGAEEDAFEPTIMEQAGTPNSATEMLKKFQAAAGSKHFSDQDELEAFASEFFESQNTSGIEDFLGLSPEQMQSILYKNFQDNTGLIELSLDACTEQDLESTPVMQQVLFILQHIASQKQGRIKATTTLGNFPRTLVSAFCALILTEEEMRLRRIKNEDDVLLLGRLRILLKMTGLIRKKHGYFHITKKAKTILDSRQFKKLYEELFLCYVDEFNWLYTTIYEDALVFVQHVCIFNLYMLRQTAADYISTDNLSSIFVQAFPGLADELQMVSKYFTALDAIDGFFYSGFLENLAFQFGLIEFKPDSEDRPRYPQFCKTTPLFERVFRWHV